MNKRAIATILIAGVIVGIAIAVVFVAGIRDRNLRAQDVAAPEDRSATARCFLIAKDRTNLLDSQIADLCLGTPSPAGPVRCYEAADEELLVTTAQRIELCRCAESAEPVDCYATLKRESLLLDAQIADLCAPAVVDQLLPNCRPIASY